MACGCGGFNPKRRYSSNRRYESRKENTKISGLLNKSVIKDSDNVKNRKEVKRTVI